MEGVHIRLCRFVQVLSCNQHSMENLPFRSLIFADLPIQIAVDFRDFMAMSDSLASGNIWTISGKSLENLFGYLW